MNIPQEQPVGPAGAPENNSQQEQREPNKIPRHADWISYAVAVTLQAPSDGADSPSDSEF
ncbi:hypothetical protein [Hymenobacter terricola]|uniref:hypothetical protein n=1 Tax=Hymenobacter terricola TaxID=2819236 RepID=UPI001B300B52|nr:hypothetical protein [Hymenobacter terricola]